MQFYSLKALFSIYNIYQGIKSNIKSEFKIYYTTNNKETKIK